MLCCIALYCIVFYCVAIYCIALYRIVLYSIINYCIVVCFRIYLSTHHKPVLEMLDMLFALFSNNGRLVLKDGSVVSDSPSTSIPVSADTTAFRSVLPNPPATTVAVATMVAFRVPFAILK